MNLLSLIKSKITFFKDTPSEVGLNAVVQHIEISEAHFKLAQNNGEYLYTDVIYRTNQAYEGAVKEAYRIINGKDPSQKTPSEIEKYFDSNKLLKERVLSQLSTYRTEWRNKSTHDYQLFFSSQEAFLAIVNVSAFLNILLDQMIEKQSFSLEKIKIEKRDNLFFNGDSNYESLSFMQQTIELLKLFSCELKNEYKKNILLSEFELVGRVTGFISVTDPKIKIFTEAKISSGTQILHPDIILTKDDTSLVIELKSLKNKNQNKVNAGIEQLKYYLIASNISNGILFVPNYSAIEDEDEYTEYFFDEPNSEIKIATLIPSILIKK